MIILEPKDNKKDKISEDEIEIKEAEPEQDAEGPSVSFSLEARKLSDEPEEKPERETDKEFMEDYAKKAMEKEKKEEPKEEKKIAPVVVKPKPKPVQKKLIEKKKPVKKVSRNHAEKIRKKEEKVRIRKEARRKKGPASWVLPVVLVILVIGVALLIMVFVQMKKPADVVATVNGEAITQTQLDRQYELLPPQYQAYFTKDVLLQQMIDELLLLQEAKRLGIKVTDSEVSSFLEKLVANNNITMDNLTQRLEEQGMTLQEFKDLYKKQMIISRLFNTTFAENYTVSDEELQAYYDQSKEQFFTTSEQVKASHILICGSEDMFCESNRTEEEALALINEIRSEVTPDNFAQYAKNYSANISSAANGGDLGFFGRGRMVLGFEEAAFATEVGEISQPLKTEYGYHIIYVTDKKTENITIPFESVKENIRAVILQERSTGLYSVLVTKLRETAQIAYPQQEAAQEQNESEEGLEQPQVDINAEPMINAGEEAETEEVPEEEQGTPEEEAVEDSQGVCEAEEPEEEVEAATPREKALANCLASKGITLYGDAGADTKIQKEVFGNYATLLLFVNCESHPEKCTGIPSYPTWVFGDIRVVGVKDLDDLEKLAKC